MSLTETTAPRRHWFHIVADFGRDRFPSRSLINEISRIVARHFFITDEEMMGNTRDQDISQARFIAMYISRRVTGESYPFIGRCFKRDQNTVRSAIDRAVEMISADKELAEAVARMERQARARG